MQGREVLEQDALEEYGRLFSKPLTQEHVAALAALFGWAIPADSRAADPHEFVLIVE
jgi:hypothetical protein